MRNYYLRKSCLATIVVCSNLSAVPFGEVANYRLDKIMKDAQVGSHWAPLATTRDGITTYDSLREIGKIASETLKNPGGYFTALLGTYNTAQATPAFDNEIFIAKALSLYVTELNAGRDIGLEGLLDRASSQLTVISNSTRKSNVQNDSRIYLNSTGLLNFVKSLHAVNKKAIELNQRAIRTVNNVRVLITDASAAANSFSDINEKRYFLHDFLFGDGTDPQNVLKKLIAFSEGKTDREKLILTQYARDFANLCIFPAVSDWGVRTSLIKGSNGKDVIRVRLAEMGFDLLKFSLANPANRQTIHDALASSRIIDGQRVGRVFDAVIGAHKDQDMIDCLRQKLSEILDCLPDDRTVQTWVTDLTMNSGRQPIEGFSDLVFTPASYTTWSVAQIRDMTARKTMLENKLKIINVLTEGYVVQQADLNRRAITVEGRNYALDPEELDLVRSLKYLEDHKNNPMVTRYLGIRLDKERDIRTKARLRKFFEGFERVCSEYSVARSQAEKNVAILKKMDLFHSISSIYPGNLSELNEYWNHLGIYFQHKAHVGLYRNEGERLAEIKEEIEKLGAFSGELGTRRARLLTFQYSRPNTRIVRDNLLALCRGGGSLISTADRTFRPILAGLPRPQAPQGTAIERLSRYYANINNLRTQLIWAENLGIEEASLRECIDSCLTVGANGTIDFDMTRCRNEKFRPWYEFLVVGERVAAIHDTDRVLNLVDDAVALYNADIVNMAQYAAIPADLGQYFIEHSFGPYLDEQACTLLERFPELTGQLRDYRANQLFAAESATGTGFVDFIFEGPQVSQLLYARYLSDVGVKEIKEKIILSDGRAQTQGIPILNFVEHFFDIDFRNCTMNVRPEYGQIRELLEAENLFVTKEESITVYIGEQKNITRYFLNQAEIVRFVNANRGTIGLVNELVAAFSQFKFDSAICVNDEFSFLQEQQRQAAGVLSWIPQLDQAAIAQTRTIEELQAKTFDIANVGDRNFSGLQNEIFAFLGRRQYRFAQTAGNLAGVACTESELRTAFQRHYGNDWNRFKSDIKNYFSTPRENIYAPPSISQRNDMAQAPKENAVIFLKLIDLCFKRNNGTGGLSLNIGGQHIGGQHIGGQQINISDANAMQRILTFSAQDINDAARASINAEYTGYNEQAYIQSPLSLKEVKLGDTDAEGQGLDRFIQDLLNTVTCVLGIHQGGGLFDSILYKPENFANVNYSFDVLLNIYNELLRLDGLFRGDDLRRKEELLTLRYLERNASCHTTVAQLRQLLSSDPRGIVDRINGIVLSQQDEANGARGILGKMQKLRETIMAEFSSDEMRGAFITSKIESATTVGSLCQAFHHCTGGQAQGIAEFVAISTKNDTQILPRVSAQGMLSILYQRAVDYAIDSNLGFVNSYEYRNGTWQNVAYNGEFSGGRGRVVNAIQNKFGRVHGGTVWDGGPGLPELARYLAGRKPDIWARMDQRFKPRGTAYERAHPGEGASEEVKRAFFTGLASDANAWQAGFVMEFAKAAITPEALLSYLSNPAVALNQALAKKLILDSNCMLSGEHLDVAQSAERRALADRIRGGEDVKFTEEQLKTVMFDGLKRYGFIR
ncbi:MAG: hypothetical protein LBU35_02470 [Holosporales bacterium]|jgi:hypothetical protein|nr:hypothetical protein [Holosporales bacterium]